FIRDLDLYHEYRLSGWMIEIPFQLHPLSPQSSFKYYETHELDTLLPILRKHQLPYSLAFTVENPRNVPLAQASIDPYFTDISGMLLRCMKARYFPRYLIFMGELCKPAFSKGKLPGFLAQVKQEFKGFEGEIVLAATPAEWLDSDYLWPLAEVVGICYREPPELEYKPYFMRINRQLSQKLIQYQKPALIVQTNLVGGRKLLLFKNQLRFWDEQTELRGIVLNSLYCEFPLADQHTHFGLAGEQEFKQYLKRYTAK
ncbi:MAG: hypothetical protein D6730_21230, partial [Bacteroidetes bacterium]